MNASNPFPGAEKRGVCPTTVCRVSAGMLGMWLELSDTVSLSHGQIRADHSGERGGATTCTARHPYQLPHQKKRRILKYRDNKQKIQITSKRGKRGSSKKKKREKVVVK